MNGLLLLSDDVLLLVLCRLDNDTLSKLSCIPLVWDIVARVIASQTQHFWFSRVQVLSRISLTFDQSCWKTTWYVIDLCSVPMQTAVGPMAGFFSVGCVTLNALKVLSSLGVSLCGGNNRALTLACRSNDVAVVAHLMDDQDVLNVEAFQTSDCLRQSVQAGSYDVVVYLLSKSGRRDLPALEAALRLDYVHIVRLLLRERPDLLLWLRCWHEHCLTEARRYKSELVIKFLQDEIQADSFCE